VGCYTVLRGMTPLPMTPLRPVVHVLIMNSTPSSLPV